MTNAITVKTLAIEGQCYTFDVVTATPSTAMKDFVDEVRDRLVGMPQEDEYTVLSHLVGGLNSAMKSVAIMGVITSDNVVKSLVDGTTYGKASVSKKCELKWVNMVTKKHTKEDGTKEDIPVIVKWLDVVKFIDRFNAEAKKHENPTLAYPRIFEKNDLRLVRAFRFNLLELGAKSKKIVDAMTAEGVEVDKAFLKTSGTGLSVQLQHFYNAIAERADYADGVLKSANKIVSGKGAPIMSYVLKYDENAHVNNQLEIDVLISGILVQAHHTLKVRTCGTVDRDKSEEETDK